MRIHHTKNKGDLGVLHAKVDLVEKGFRILVPESEHEAYDLVTYKDGGFLRVQVKYRAAVNGVISLALKTSWADRHGTHDLPIDKTAIDLLCIYCPDTRSCYYVDVNQFKRLVSLRITPPRNNWVKRVKWAKDFTDIPPSVVGIPAGCRATLEGSANVRQS